VGFVVVPDAWVPKIERAIRVTTWCTPGVTTAIACAWLEDGTVERLEAQKRQDAAARQAIAAEVLAGLRCVRHPASYFVWLPLPEETRADRVAAALVREGVSVSTAEPFAATPHVPHALRLALGSVDLASLRSALQTVRRVVGEQSW
jgi:DNA-binding transcriptional MocR family regulator